MQEPVLYIVLVLLCVVIYLLLNQKKNLENIKDPEQVEKAIKEDVDKIKILNK